MPVKRGEERGLRLGRYTERWLGNSLSSIQRTVVGLRVAGSDLGPLATENW